jgi:hypothetical protein
MLLQISIISGGVIERWSWFVLVAALIVAAIVVVVAWLLRQLLPGGRWALLRPPRWRAPSSNSRLWRWLVFAAVAGFFMGLVLGLELILLNWFFPL